ncbi:cysteine hydrolase family protein [Thermocaproicibacter melissae]|jgi:nicotinamidase/pyrazinamidase|uniref:cysteine hydrolase family protein n=1 Tax=Thermocaproicibacter melissae TaxID=2966552 RepID=UPI0024B10E04|nr:isochorismatase family cysteine hydrolase [Thermocaproicibacter melissae]WBY63353.1 cysteine hydrolase [Thermocaproicibacter melissae]
MKCLVVVDVQNDFITGALGTEEARLMLPRLLKKVREFEGDIYLTQDTHTEEYLKTQEGRMLPVPHCIAGTDGWRFPAELEQLRQERKAKVYEKSCFGSTRLMADLKKIYDQKNLDSIEIVGLCTDICVVSNALMLKAAMPELPIYVDADCCAGVSPEKHEAALSVMESCQIIVKGGHRAQSEPGSQNG